MMRTLMMAAALCVALIVMPAVSFASDSATYGYDQNGRLHTVTYANGTVVTYNYDTAGNRSTVTTSCSGSGC